MEIGKTTVELGLLLRPGKKKEEEDRDTERKTKRKENTKRRGHRHLEIGANVRLASDRL